MTESNMHTERDILGLDSSAPPHAAQIANLHDLTQAGLPYSALEHIRHKLHLTQEEESRLLAVSSSTLRRAKGKRLATGTSDRLVRLARLLILAETVLESESAAAAWLREPIPALDGQIPLNLVSTDWGAERVRDILLRIEHGLFA